MGRQVFERMDNSRNVVLVVNQSLDHFGVSLRDGAGFVEHHNVDFTRHFQAGSILYQHADVGSASHTHNDGRGGGQS